LPAALADDVVVMRLALDGLVARLSVVEVALRREAALLEELQRAVDGGVADPRVHATDGVVELLDREVLLGAEEHARDVVALRRRLEPPFAQRLLELPHAGTHRHAGSAPSRGRRAVARAAVAAPASGTPRRRRARRAGRRAPAAAPPGTRRGRGR